MLPRPVPRRVLQLLVGLVLYGVTMGLMVRSGLGLDPWDVFHEGLADRTPLSFGTVTIVVGALVLLAWVPLRQRPGVGTVANVFVVGLAADATLWLVPRPEPMALQVAYLVAGVLGNGVAGGMYIGAGLGPGPRDGLMTGLVRRSGRSVRLVRTTIELTVLGVGWLIGGTVGVGTVLYALAIGPLVQLTLGWFTIRPAGPDRPATTPTGTATPAPSTAPSPPPSPALSPPPSRRPRRARQPRRAVAAGLVPAGTT
jgi:uncharacterized membrane protein YczE